MKELLYPITVNTAGWNEPAEYETFRVRDFGPGLKRLCREYGGREHYRLARTNGAGDEGVSGVRRFVKNQTHNAERRAWRLALRKLDMQADVDDVSLYHRGKVHHGDLTREL